MTLKTEHKYHGAIPIIQAYLSYVVQYLNIMDHSYLLNIHVIPNKVSFEHP